jgi:outer membrane protein
MRGWRTTGLATMAVAALGILGTGAVANAQAPGAPAPAPPAPLSTAPAPAAGASGLTGKIAYVDVQRVIARAAAGVAAREQIEREKTNMQKEMEGKRQELEKLREEIEKKGPLMTAENRREKQDTFERKRRDAARLADDFQKELEKREQTLLQKVLQELSVVIERVGKERGFYLIIEKRGATVLYASTEADLTDDVIRAYDQQAGANKGKK